MKLIKKSLAILGALCLLAGCSTNLDIKKLGNPSSYKAPAALSPSSIHLRGTSYDAKSSELYQKLTGAGVPHGKEVPVDIVISSTIGSDFPSLESPAKTISVFTEDIPTR